MEAAHNRGTMSTWEPVVFETDSSEIEDVKEAHASPVGLDAQPEQLHADFQVQADHLSEVQMNHQQVLVAAGMIPESHLAEVAPERQLAWMVEQLHGTVNPDGLMIPLHGAKDSDIEVSTLQGEAHRKLRLVVKEAEHDDLLRIVPLPPGAGEIKAHFINGRLHLRW